MLSVFYQRKPEPDTPYRTLVLRRDPEKGHWYVRMTGGTKFEPNGDSQVLKDEPVKNWNEGKDVYDRMFAELTDAGWRLYTPQEDWQSRPMVTFQREVK